MLHPITIGAISAARTYENWVSEMIRSLDYNETKDSERSVTLGEVAARSGAAMSMWCARCLPDAARRDLIRSILPSVKRASHCTSDKRVNECISSIDLWLAGHDSDLLAAFNAGKAVERHANEKWSRAGSPLYAAEERAAYAAAWLAYAALTKSATESSYAAINAAEAAADAHPVAERDGERTRQIADIIAVFGSST